MSWTASYLHIQLNSSVKFEVSAPFTTLPLPKEEALYISVVFMSSLDISASARLSKTDFFYLHLLKLINHPVYSSADGTGPLSNIHISVDNASKLTSINKQAYFFCNFLFSALSGFLLDLDTSNSNSEAPYNATTTTTASSDLWGDFDSPKWERILSAFSPSALSVNFCSNFCNFIFPIMGSCISPCQAGLPPIPVCFSGYVFHKVFGSSSSSSLSIHPSMFLFNSAFPPLHKVFHFYRNDHSRDLKGDIIINISRRNLMKYSTEWILCTENIYVSVHMIGGL